MHLGRYGVWEVGVGRATRQPGQVRKEAALTISVWVTTSIFHFSHMFANSGLATGIGFALDNFNE